MVCLRLFLFLAETSYLKKLATSLSKNYKIMNIDNLSKTIKHFGECTAYSSKGHFKSADFRRLLNYFLIIINIVFSVFAMLDIFSDATIKIMGAISLCASITIMVYQTKTESDFISDSMKSGEDYLKLHNDILILFTKGNYTTELVEEIKEKVNRLNSKKKPSISFIAKYWAKSAIEKKGEMNIWWK